MKWAKNVKKKNPFSKKRKRIKN
jgi:hypothetical protein